MMASGVGDIDTSEQIMRDMEMANDTESSYNVPVLNSFDWNGQNSGWGNDEGFCVVDRSYKRKRISTGGTGDCIPGMTSETFQTLHTDDKLTVLFDMMNSVHVKQDRTSADIQNMNRLMNSSSQKTDRVEKNVNLYSKQLKVLSYRSIDQEARSRRNNLLFWGLTENTPRNCEKLILNVIAREMRIDNAGIVIDRAHRVGAIKATHIINRTDPKRPLIVRFRDYRDTEQILEKAFLLKGTHF